MSSPSPAGANMASRYTANTTSSEADEHRPSSSGSPQVPSAEPNMGNTPQEPHPVPSMGNTPQEVQEVQHADGSQMDVDPPQEPTAFASQALLGALPTAPRQRQPRAPVPRTQETIKATSADIRTRMEAFRKRKAEEAHSAESSSKAPRVMDPQPATGSPPPVTIPSAAPRVQQIAAPRPPLLAFKNRLDARTLKCALRIDGEGLSPIGNPYKTNVGITINLHIDAGRTGNPCLSIRFRVNKDVRFGTGNVSNNDDDVHSFAITWFPSVQINDAWMMENCHYAGGPEGIRNDIVQDPAIRNLCDRNYGMTHTVSLTFLSRTARLEGYDPRFSLGLEQNVEATLDRLFLHNGQHTQDITLWFENPCRFIDNGDAVKTWNECEERLLRPLQRACEDRVPQYSQYLDARGRFDPDLRTFPTIEEVGEGMYVGKSVKNVRQYHTLPPQTTWMSLQEFEIFGTGSVIRDHQYVEGQYAHIQAAPHRVFMQRFPIPTIDSSITEGISKEHRAMNNTYFAYVRMTRDADGKRDEVPVEGTTVVMEWDNSQGARLHTPVHKSLQMRGEVLRPVERDLRLTRTDFCVLVHTTGRVDMKKAFDTLEYKKNQELPLVRIKVRVNEGPAKKAIESMGLMSDVQYEREALGLIRTALVAEPSRLRHTTTNLAEGLAETPEGKAANVKIYDDYVSKFVDLKNPSRTAVMQSVKTLTNKIAMVQGPPGTTKTSTGAVIMAGLMETGHKIAFSAASNAAVDTAAMALYATMPKKFKAVRLEVFSNERGNLMEQNDFQDPSLSNREVKEAANMVKDPLDDLRVQAQFAKVVADQTANSDAFERFSRELEAHEEAVARTREELSKQIANVPLEMTLGYRIFEEIKESKAAAQAEFQRRLEAMTDVVERGDFMAQHTWEEFDETREYRECINLFIRKDGKLNKTQQAAFQEERIKIIARVLGKMNAVFTTCVNSGSDWIVDNFEPTVLVIDEGGQVSIPAFTVPLTKYKSWKGLILLGDVEQLKPTVLSRGLNEFIQHAKTSPMGLLIAKGFPCFKLTKQYRSDPEIMKFPAAHFYSPGDLEDHEVTKEDNPTREIMRLVSMKYYNIRQDFDGSVYWFVDVIHATSRPEANGTSLQNWTNAAAIATATRRLLQEGLKESQISVLTMYKGNISIIADALRRALEEKIPAADGTTRKADYAAVVISTTDAFQGKETDVALIDSVSANENISGKGLSSRRTTASGHVKDPNRLNVTLTRAKHGLIFFGQGSLLLQTLDETHGRANNVKSKRANTLCLLVKDAYDRGLIYEDNEHIDMHPEAVAAREKMDREALAYEHESNRWARLKFIQDRLHRTRQTIFSDQPEEVQFPKYPTGSGATTRPTGDPDIIASADAHDQAPSLSPPSQFPWDEEFDAQPELFGAQSTTPPQTAKGKEKADVEMNDAGSGAGSMGTGGGNAGEHGARGGHGEGNHGMGNRGGGSRAGGSRAGGSRAGGNRAGGNRWGGNHGGGNRGGGNHGGGSRGGRASGQGRPSGGADSGGRGKGGGR